MSDLVLQNPALLVLLAGDIIAGEPFKLPSAVVAAGHGRGRGCDTAAVGAPTEASVSDGVPPELRFINLATLDKLVDPTNSAPMTAVALLAGFLGPCLKNAIRDNELSTVRTIAVLLRAHLARDLDAVTAASSNADPILALQLSGFVVAAYRSLNEVFRAATLNEFAMQRESMSSYKYFLGKESERSAVETQGRPLLDDK